MTKAITAPLAVPVQAVPLSAETSALAPATRCTYESDLAGLQTHLDGQPFSDAALESYIQHRPSRAGIPTGLWRQPGRAANSQGQASAPSRALNGQRRRQLALGNVQRSAGQRPAVQLAPHSARRDPEQA